MPIIQIWGVPDFIPGKRLIPLKQQIKKDVAQIRALGLTPARPSAGRVRRRNYHLGHRPI